jgi:hypothetical protein
MPPGAPDWGLPPSAMPMVWEGLSDRQLCKLLKDPTRNGHRTVEQIVEHMHTPLVLWGWAPGDGRTPIPTPQNSFLLNVQQWVAKGAACPLAASTQISLATELTGPIRKPALGSGYAVDRLDLGPRVPDGRRKAKLKAESKTMD